MISSRRAPLLPCILAAAALATGALAEPDARTRDEIEHLLAYLAASECEFFRNGSWHDAESAARHVRRKYEHLARRDGIPTTESFIDGAPSLRSPAPRAERTVIRGNARTSTGLGYLSWRGS